MPGEELKLGGAFDEDRLSRLVTLMKEHGLSELELRDTDQLIRISRPPHGAGPPPSSQVAPGGYALPAPPQAASAAVAHTAIPSQSVGESEGILVIKSPMVGTFYSRPNPNAAAFVKIGDHVEPETTICIIEAMKVFNEIPAEVRGRIVAVLVDDEEAVEFGKPLFKVDTKG